MDRRVVVLGEIFLDLIIILLTVILKILSLSLTSELARYHWIWALQWIRLSGYEIDRFTPKVKIEGLYAWFWLLQILAVKKIWFKFLKFSIKQVFKWHFTHLKHFKLLSDLRLCCFIEKDLWYHSSHPKIMRNHVHTGSPFKCEKISIVRWSNGHRFVYLPYVNNLADPLTGLSNPLPSSDPKGVGGRSIRYC